MRAKMVCRDLGQSLAQAVGFLTPLGFAGKAPSPEAMAWFPLVGAGIGLGVGTSWRGARRHVGPSSAAVLALGLDALLTGALHLDGLGDSADGLLAHAPKKSRLAIMSEPDLGTFGTLAIALSLSARQAALSELEASPTLFAALYGLSRSLMVIATRLVPYARSEGLASGFLPSEGAPDFPFGFALAGAGLSLLSLRLSGGRRALLAGLAGSASAGLVLGLARRRIGGFTGDVLGALGLCCESIALLVIARR